MNSVEELISLYIELMNINENMEHYKYDMDKWMKLYWDAIITEAKIKGLQ